MAKSRDIADSASVINYIDGLTSDAQGQLNDKATLDGSPTFTGTVTATAFSGDGSGLTGVDSLPSQTGNAGKFLTTDGSAASWGAAGGGAWTYLNTTTISSSVASAEITSGIDSTYDMYAIQLIKVEPQATGGRFFRMRTSSNGGTSYDSGGSDYQWQGVASTTTANSVGGDLAKEFIQFADAGIGANADEYINGWIYMIKPSDAERVTFFWDLIQVTYPSYKMERIVGSAKREAAADVDALQFYMSSDNLVSGTFRLYGIKNS